MKTLYLAGGCFWGTQRFLDQFKGHGVVSTEVGYANGPTENPSYEEVCKDAGHAETVKVTFDEAAMPAEGLLEFFFRSIDPTEINHQGGDFGIQYRTGIWYEDETLAPAVESAVKKEKRKLGLRAGKFAVETGKLQNFYTAEEYHQKYLVKHPTGYCHIDPKLFHLADTLD